MISIVPDRAVLEAQIDRNEMEAFDQVVFARLVGRAGCRSVTLSTVFNSFPYVARRISIECEMEVKVSLTVSLPRGDHRRAQIYVLGSRAYHPRHYFSFDDLCAIFFPRREGW